MSNTNYKVTNGGVTYDLIQLFMYGNSGVGTGYNDPSGVDLGSIFMLKTTNTLPFNTNYVVSVPPYINSDFTTIFNGITPLSQVYSISNASNITVSYSQTSQYSALIFDSLNTRAWNGTPPPLAQCRVTFSKPVVLNFLIVGGGGGGGQSANVSNCGAGGSGGGVIFTIYTQPSSNVFDVQVGYNGGGNNNPAGVPLSGQCTGATGGDSYVSNSIFSLTAYGGGGGGGVGTVDRNPSAGNANMNLFSSTDYTIFTGRGGGGGSGGGARSTNASRFAGFPGYFNYGNDLTPIFQGNKGQDGTSNSRGNGGLSYTTAQPTQLNVPFTDNLIAYQSTFSTTVFCGNGGSGGDSNEGGKAGKGINGGQGGSGVRFGQDAISGYDGGNFYYGNGGGGAGSKNTVSTVTQGGNGGRGVVMMWWQIV